MPQAVSLRRARRNRGRVIRVPCYPAKHGRSGSPREVLAFRRFVLVRYSGQAAPLPNTPLQRSTGMTAPTFSELGVSTPVVDALAAREIYHTFAIQAMVAEDALDGRDVLAKSPTGSGKTLAFAITIIERISRDDLAPAGARAGAHPRAGRAGDRGVRDAGRRPRPAGGGGLRRRGDARPGQDAPAAPTSWWRRPGRLTDLMQQGVVNLSAVQIFVLDEADRMLDMGFKPQVDRIVRKLPEERQTMFFSATLDGEVGVAGPRLHDRRHPPRGREPDLHGGADRAPVHPGHARQQA